MAFHLTRGKVNRSSLVVVMFQGYVFRVYLITKDNQSALWENSWIDRWLIWIFELCIYHRPSPGGGTPGKFNVEWGLIQGFERLTYPGGGGNEGGLFSKSLAPRGKRGTLQTKRFSLFKWIVGRRCGCDAWVLLWYVLHLSIIEFW